MPQGTRRERYAAAFLDWLACASGGLDQPAAWAARATCDAVLALGTAGHVLDFDDTFAPGLAHLSAPTAPTALVIAAEVDANVGQMLSAYAEGFEAMGALARASHPALYEGGWHPTAVCGVVGAAVTAACLLGARREAAVAIAVLRASGLQAGFGSDGKSLQVGMSASSGVLAARLSAHGAAVPLDRVLVGPAGFEAVFGASFRQAPDDGERAIEENWIKAWPCCLQTHSTIEAAERARTSGVELGTPLEVMVHPVSLRAAAYGPRPADGLQAKFSIPYLVAYTIARGAPRVESFADIDTDLARAAADIRVSADAGLAESEAVLLAGGAQFRIAAALGSPQRPMDAEALSAKVRRLARAALIGTLDDPECPARSVLEQLWPPSARVDAGPANERSLADNAQLRQPRPKPLADRT